MVTQDLTNNVKTQDNLTKENKKKTQAVKQQIQNEKQTRNKQQYGYGYG